MKAEKITEDIKPYSPLVVQVRIKTGIGIGIENTHSLFSAVFFSNFLVLKALPVFIATRA